MSRPIYSDAKKAKMCRSSSSLSHFFLRDFSRTIADTDIINTSLEPLRLADVPFRSYKTETKDLGGIFCREIDFLAVVEPSSEL